MTDTAKKLLSFLSKTPSVFHVIAEVKKELQENGFTELSESESWTLEPDKGYFVTRNGSSLIAFRIPNDRKPGYRIVASHSDSPGFKLKQKPVISVDGKYSVLGTESYGGGIFSTWMDRPLSVAGRVFTGEDGKLTEKLVNVDRDMCIMPNAPIHFNRSVNKGHEFNVAKDMKPIYGEAGAEAEFEAEIAAAAGVNPEDVLAKDLFLYVREQGRIWGRNEEFVSAPKLDDLACAYVTLRGFLEGKKTQHSSFYCVFDNEETGSGTRQGAASLFFYDVMRRVNENLGCSYEQHVIDVAEGMALSADNAHAFSPNYSEFFDPNEKVVMNRGIALKFNAAQKYSTDGESGAFFAELCKKAEVPYQIYSNRADLAGGSTLGNIMSMNIPVRVCDLGFPQLAMHSSFETCGASDIEYMRKAIKVFFE